MAQARNARRPLQWPKTTRFICDLWLALISKESYLLSSPPIRAENELPWELSSNLGSDVFDFSWIFKIIPLKMSEIDRGLFESSDEAENFLGFKEDIARKRTESDGDSDISVNEEETSDTDFSDSGELRCWGLRKWNWPYKYSTCRGQGRWILSSNVSWRPYWIDSDGN